ncbi:MAG: hypothetical protein MUF38_06190 [Anaerolineae bacterium]|jgi:hypothetical protein|nr:hypothetical protein [Anaerolineae bacterium]
MTHPPLYRTVQHSLIAITITGILTTIHHVYRLGLEVLPMFALITALPFAVLWLHQKLNQRWMLWLYAALNTLIFVAFGFMDGFLDHVIKALGLQNITFLEGSDAEVVETVFSLWSPEAGYIFYEWTGIATFVVSVVAMVYTARMLYGVFGQRARTSAQTAS